uniref:Uncharacterized protein n=1 Tax=Acinetobacter sp. M131 TaxID=1280052 RepID=V9M5C5_9GAMM|nr:hypothetical protein [Acinetobacter sp. M131]AGC70589.1 hypothetical protein [Acinetobacter sp. M131]
MIIITLGKYALPPGLDQEKYLQDFRAAFKAEYDYPIMFTEDQTIDGIKISFRFTNRGVPLKIADNIIKKIQSAFNVQ